MDYVIFGGRYVIFEGGKYVLVIVIGIRRPKLNMRQTGFEAQLCANIGPNNFTVVSFLRQFVPNFSPERSV